MNNIKKNMRELLSQLEALVHRPVEDLGSAEVAAEAARLLRDLLRLEADAVALLSRISGDAGSVREQARRYESSDYRGLTLHEAARRVLAAAGSPMHVRDLGARIKAAGWRHPRSPHARDDQIEYQLAARLPRHPDAFRKVAPNTFGLAVWPDLPPALPARPTLSPVRGRGPKLARRIGDDPELVFGERPKWRSS